MERARGKKKMVVEEENAIVDKVLGNIDLLTKILNLLPPKPLVRSKAISHHWLAVISDPQFLFTYTCHYRTTHPPSTFSHFYYGSIPISLDGSDQVIPKIDCIEGLQLNAPNTDDLVLLNSCNGLVLYNMCSSFIVFNPTTNKHRPLPKFGKFAHWDTVLAFDPLESFNYKVVRFKSLPFDRTNDYSRYDYYGRSPEECVIDIFSSKSGLWKEICFPAPSVGLTMSKRVFWNGAIHWISGTNFHVKFNVDEENFTWKEIPTDPNTLRAVRYMGECDSGLLLIKFSRNGNFLSVGKKCTFTILELKKDSDCWVSKHHVNLEMLLPQMGLIRSKSAFVYTVLYILSESDKDCFTLVLGIYGKIVLYSINNRNNHIATKEIKDFPECDYRSRSLDCKFFPFIPCLAPV